MLDRTEAAQILEIIDIDVPVVDLVAALPQQVADHVLTRTFRTARARDRDEIACRGELRVKSCVDGIHDTALIVTAAHATSCSAGSWVGFPSINHTFALDAACFENRTSASTVRRTPPQESPCRS